MYHTIVLIYFALINAVGFIIMAADKYKAQRQKWRIPEKKMFLCAILGGALGVWLGMKAFRHKTQHKIFVYGIPALVLWNVVLIAALLLWPLW